MDNLEEFDEEEPYANRDSQKETSGTLLVVVAIATAAVGAIVMDGNVAMYVSAEFLGGAGLWALLRGRSPVGAAMPALGLALLIVYTAMEPFRLGDASVAYAAFGMAFVLFALGAYSIVVSFDES